MSNPRTFQSPLLHPTAAGDDTVAVALSAARAFVRVNSRADAALVLHAAVSALGGALVPARESDSDALPLDVSLGVGEPQLVVPADGQASALDRLARALPAIIEDAMAAAAHCDDYEHQARRASIDDLTGVASRGEIYRQLGAACAADVVGLIDLDEFKALNDTRGHAAGDEALQSFGQTLQGHFRGDDFVGRYGGDEFLLILKASPLTVAVQRCEVLVQVWSTAAGPRPTVSVGLARVDSRGGAVALRAADLALYQAKRRGRNSIACASFTDTRTDEVCS